MASRKGQTSSPLDTCQPYAHERVKLAETPLESELDHLSESCPSEAQYPNCEVDIEGEWAQEHEIKGLPDATVFYQHEFIDEVTANQWYTQLTELETWYRPTLSMYGKPYVQSRSIASYVTSPSLTARYSGHSVKMNHPYPPLLEEIQRTVSERLGVGFDHVMLNWYQDGSVHIGKHRDTKENQVIASLSLGAKRTFIMHPHISKGEKKVAGAEVKKWVLGNGSLLVMQGDTQENWKHEIPKEPKIKEGRISLTFRQLVHQKR
ncbi:hypothetical protein M408DRAFT_28706 [Serendipita vermifera MAFF 305830]|uniref:Fe2OG dioxygenase domain-containing protein n=1 Tax=Serendipita vermifera MAFF 305830 TaxID=933852 RepID=A0A0C2WYT0_SERVB|nr:hypothetical protein M408DRAFT_28706 [Serendipita vermifera MAFF 305830]